MRDDDSNYYNDSRVRGGERANRKFVVEVDRDPTPEWPDGFMEEIPLPTKKIVCPTCDGKGHHVNPSIDAHGLSREDFDDDPDFREDYMRGRYDVPCYECHGANVVDDVDRDACDPELLKQWDEKLQWEAYDRADRMNAMRYGY